MVAVFVGVGMTSSFVAFNTNRNSIADLIEWNAGHRIDSMVTTVDNMFSKLGRSLVVLANSFLLASAGYDATLAVVPASAAGAIEVMIGWVPLVIALVMVVIGLKFPIEAEIDKMNAERLGE